MACCGLTARSGMKWTDGEDWVVMKWTDGEDWVEMLCPDGEG